MPKDILSGKTILVTGGTGSIGTEIVKQALDQDAGAVVVFSRDEIKHFLMKKRIPDERLKTVTGDVRDYRSMERLFDRFKIDIVYHAAAMKHVVMCEDFPIEAVQTNISGTQNTVDQALKHSVSKVITISTDKAAYAVNVLGASKFIGERITLNANEMSGANRAFSCVRFGNVTNSRGSVIPVFVDNLLNHKPIQVTDREVTRFIMRMSDAVKLIMKATGYAQGGEIFILKMRAFRLGDLVDVMVERIAPRLKISSEQIEFSMSGLTKGEKLHEDLINDTEVSRLYELDDMYVVLPGDEAASRYPSARKADLAGYISRDVALLSKDELEEIALDYVRRPSSNLLFG